MSRPLLMFESRGALMQAAADRMGDAIGRALATHGDACLALSGGGTPEPAYALLAQRDLDWPRVTFALVDERFVPPEHNASNEKMLRRALAPALARGARLAPLYFAAANLDAAAAEADAHYAPLRIDYASMGMGEDGHTASWFADADGLALALDPMSTRIVAPVRAPQAAGSAERLTLTKPALRRVPEIDLLIAGDAKRAALQRADAGAWAPVQELLMLEGPRLNILWAP